MIASILSGPGEKLNLVPMNASLNRKEWREMEKEWVENLDAGKNVEVKISPIYADNSKRPSAFVMEYKIDNVVKNVNFKNVEGGK